MKKKRKKKRKGGRVGESHETPVGFSEWAGRCGGRRLRAPDAAEIFRGFQVMFPTGSAHISPMRRWSCMGGGGGGWRGVTHERIEKGHSSDL